MKDAEDKKYAASLSEQQVELDDDIAKCEQHLAALKRKIAALDANPEASFFAPRHGRPLRRGARLREQLFVVP